MSMAETGTGATGTGVLRITLCGQFRIETPEGVELTPVGAKAQGLLALIATDRHLRRGRVWLIDKLWSDRAQPQGQASLRQALVEIRKALGPWAEAFLTDRRAVALDPELVRVIAGPQDGEFLEGIDIRDPEFDDWLRQMRTAFEAQAEPGGSAGQGVQTPQTAGGMILPGAGQPTPRAQLVLEAHSAPGDPARDTEDWFIDVLFRTLGEQFTYDIHFQMPPQAPPGGLVLLKVQSFAQGLLAGSMRVVVVEMPSGRTLWTETLRPDAGEEGTVALYAMSHRALRAVSDGLSHTSGPHPGDADANHLAAMALQNMFSMRGEALEKADRQLVAALALEERGVFHAWRAQLAAIRHIEQTGRDRDELNALSRAACARALELESQNSSVLSGVANARLVLEGDGIASGNLAQAGVDANPANPLAWWALANARLYSGQPEDAWQAALMSQRLAAKSNFRFWTDFQVSLVAAVTGRTREAIDFGEMSGALAPNFRPPMRYLTALYAAQGDRKNATRAARQLAEREPGFTLAKMMDDPAYPVSMMRQAGLLDRARLSELDL